MSLARGARGANPGLLCFLSRTVGVKRSLTLRPGQAVHTDRLARHKLPVGAVQNLRKFQGC